MDPRPTAIVAGGNQVLAGCIRALHRHGIRIPDDISLVTCDEVDLSRAPRAADRVGRARHAAASAGPRRSCSSSGIGGGEPRTVLLPTTFTPRPSCGPVPTASDPVRLARARQRPAGAPVGR